MADKHAVVRTDNMSGTTDGSQLVSVKYLGVDGATETEIDNGNVLEIGALVEGEREIYAGKAPTASSDIKDVVLIASVEVMYDERKKNLDEFYNEAGKICRGYHLHTDNIFSVTAEALDGEPAIGNVVELTDGTKLKVVASATSGSTTVGKIIEKEIVGRHTYYAIKIY